MSRQRQRWAFFGNFLLLLVGCEKLPRSNQELVTMVSNSDTKVPEITSESEEGFVDLVFQVKEYKQQSDGSQIIRAAGIHRGREVGFEVVLGPTWKRRQFGKDIPLEMCQGTVSYRRVGPTSDVFLQILDELYRTQQCPKTMAADTSFSGISLKGEPGNLANGPVKIKLFYEKGGEDRYAELYTNIDLDTGKLEVREKDEGYRGHLIQALRGQ